MLTDPSFRTAQALVIDGNATMRRTVLGQLRALGVEKIQQCKGLVDAKALLEQVAFDFVLCADLIDGSELTGQSLLEELRREMTLPHSTVFVMMAGEATYATVVEAAEAALDCFLLRPFRLNSLAERLIVARRRKVALGSILAALDAGQPAVALAACLQRYDAAAPFALHCARMAAEILLQTGRTGEALALFRRVDQAQQPTWAQLGIARALFAQGDTGGACQQVTDLLARQPGMVDAYDVLGRVQLEQGDLLQAMRTHATVAEMTPGCIMRMQQCGTLAFFVGDQPLATKMLERAVLQGLSSRLFDGLTLLLLAFVRHDAADTRRLATASSQVQQHAKAPRQHSGCSASRLPPRPCKCCWRTSWTRPATASWPWPPMCTQRTLTWRPPIWCWPCGAACLRATLPPASKSAWCAASRCGFVCPRPSPRSWWHRPSATPASAPSCAPAMRPSTCWLRPPRPWPAKARPGRRSAICWPTVPRTATPG